MQELNTEKRKILHKELHKEFYLTCEKYYIFELLTVAGGMMGLYTYNLRGGVFSNAQTGNIVKMSAAFGRGDWGECFYYFIPMTAYILGTILSEILPEKVKHTGIIRWDTLLVGIEIIVLFFIGLMPFTWPDQIAQVIINFLCAMQFNTFRQAEGVPMATTFVTNHVRQIGISLARIIRHYEEEAEAKEELEEHIGMHLAKINRHHEPEAEARAKIAKHAKIILAFFAGGAIVTALSPYLQEITIWLAIIPLSVCFAVMLRSDLVYERAMLDLTPHGH
ncbi:MAG: DUF1275 domain-containing protein [Synergistaceae bacterium]|nr:DUF1275 domain-containing protein [Synergistaceae bacterium]